MMASSVEGEGGRSRSVDRWKESAVEHDDPFTEQTLELGLGSDSRLQKETVVLDITMEKHLDRHWQARCAMSSTLACLLRPSSTFVCIPVQGMATSPSRLNG
jgi:hypothetical protein